jgi:hypothetical protein
MPLTAIFVRKFANFKGYIYIKIVKKYNLPSNIVHLHQ